ncbi:MAG: hypothetical protein IKT38_03205 [Clostridia bacterium]|nr:hypothetical protein [Clostridia bacterium]
MMREIGSEFWEVPVCDSTNEIFPYNTEWYLSGRSALIAIIKDIKKRISFNSVALPSWCCDSMIQPFLNEYISVKFYSVEFKNGQPRYDFSGIYDCDAMLIMDYFGYIRAIDHNFKGLIINDITHSVFLKKIHKSDYVFGSLRKWAGFFTGGFAYKNDGGKLECYQTAKDDRYIKIRKLAMSKKAKYISGKTDKKDFLEDFSLAEDVLDEFFCGSADDFDIARAKQIDVEFIKSRRRENASVILGQFADLAVFSELKEDDCPLFVPLVIKNGNRDRLRKHLIDKKIYCPVHWPFTKLHDLNQEQLEIYTNEISIVCDQRYVAEDMERICEEIKVFLNRG